LMKLASGVKLYTPKVNKGRFTEAQTMWVIESASQCRWGPDNGQWPTGMQVVVKDGFEITDMVLDFWETYENDPRFAELKAEAQSLDARVHTAIISESSIEATKGD
jgi:hypothetical protein